MKLPRFVLLVALAPLPGLGLACADSAGPAPGAPEVAALQLVGGDGQHGEPGQPLGQPLAVRAVDGRGEPVPDAAVTWMVVGGEGVVEQASARTDGDGVATASLRLGYALGQHAARVRIGAAERLFTAVAPPETFNVWIESVQLNQANQSRDGGIPGVAGRPGLLRVVVRANAPNAHAPAVQVRLHGPDGVVREALIPAPPRTGIPTAPRLDLASDTWNLELSAGEVLEGLRVEAVVDPAAAIAVARPEDNRYPAGAGTADLSVRRLAPLRIVFVPVRPDDSERAGTVTPETVEAMLANVRRWFPAAEVTARTATVMESGHDLTDPLAWRALSFDILGVREADGATDEYYVGVLPHRGGRVFSGYSLRPPSPASPERVAIVTDLLEVDGWPVTIWRMAHELGHLLGMGHAPCNQMSGIEPEFPYADGGVGGLGYDVVEGRVVPANSRKDFMSYCSPAFWVSDHSYRRMLEWRLADPLAPAPPGDGRAADG